MENPVSVAMIFLSLVVAGALLMYGMAWYFALIIIACGVLFKPILKAIQSGKHKREFPNRSVEKTIDAVIKYLDLLEAKKPEDIKKKDYCFQHIIPYRWQQLSMFQSSWLLMATIKKDKSVNETHTGKDVLVTLTNREHGSSVNILGTLQEIKGCTHFWAVVQMFMNKGWNADAMTKELWEIKQRIEPAEEFEPNKVKELIDIIRGEKEK